MPSPHSSIATDPEVRAVIDALLFQGVSPHQIAEQVGARLGVSRSAVYRYSRSWNSNLTPRWSSPDTRTDEVTGDLAAVRRDLRRRFDAAGSNLDAARLAREIVAVSTTLAREFNVDPDDEPEPSMDEAAVDSLLTASRRRPGFAREFAQAARAEGHDLFAGRLDALAADLESDLNKEN